MRSVCSVFLLALVSANVFAGGPSIVKMGSSPAEVDALMKSKSAVKRTTELRTTSSVPMYKSEDKKFSSSLFSSSSGSAEFESYKADEFCYIVAGEVTFTSADGTATKLVAGDAIIIPKGWSGKVTTSGYTKFSASYRDE